ncbi:hypothetical protein NL676_009243 [Syzygium grande]|nr:hypothetical protein NL676_009243 [Syzygium grande]
MLARCTWKGEQSYRIEGSQGEVVGYKKLFTFEPKASSSGEADKAENGRWIMYEYSKHPHNLIERDRDGFSPTPPAPPPSHQEEAIAAAAAAAADSRAAPAPPAPALLSGRRSSPAAAPLRPPLSDAASFPAIGSPWINPNYRRGDTAKPDPRFTP